MVWRQGELPSARPDLELLREVLANLLENAVKCSRGRKLAVVEVWAEQTPGEVILAVQDNEVGFGSQHVGRV